MFSCGVMSDFLLLSLCDCCMDLCLYPLLLKVIGTLQVLCSLLGYSGSVGGLPVTLTSAGNLLSSIWLGTRDVYSYV